MITGVVSDSREAIVSLTLRGPAGAQFVLDVVIDTGFSDFLTLPPEVIDVLELPYRETARFTLADGAETNLDVFRVDVLWHDEWRGALATSADGSSLLGMSLLWGSDLKLRAGNGGQVEIEPIR